MILSWQVDYLTCLAVVGSDGSSSSACVVSGSANGMLLVWDVDGR